MTFIPLPNVAPQLFLCEWEGHAPPALQPIGNTGQEQAQCQLLCEHKPFKCQPRPDQHSTIDGTEQNNACSKTQTQALALALREGPTHMSERLTSAPSQAHKLNKGKTLNKLYTVVLPSKAAYNPP